MGLAAVTASVPVLPRLVAADGAHPAVTPHPCGHAENGGHSVSRRSLRVAAVTPGRGGYGDDVGWGDGQLGLGVEEDDSDGPVKESMLTTLLEMGFPPPRAKVTPLGLRESGRARVAC